MKSWRTTLFGALGAIAIALNDVVSVGGVDNRTIIFAAISAGLGFLAKDKNVTGGK